MLRSLARRGARVTWDSIRADLIKEVCVGSGVGHSFPTSSLVRGDAPVVARLDKLIETAQASVALIADKADVSQRARLASLLDLRGCHEEALSLFATDRGEGETLPPAVRFLLEIVERHASQEKERERRSSESVVMPSGILNVDVVQAADFTAHDVMERYIKPGLPCVLRGANIAPKWTPEELANRLGSRRVPLRRCDSSSAAWARLTFAGSEPFSTFVEREIFAGSAAQRGDPQLFDYSIWQSCNDILGNDIYMPKWFSVDLFSYTTARVHPVSGSASPTLFLAAQGTGSALHVDFMQTHFWMALGHGCKRWRLLPRDDLAMLYPRYLVDLNPSFPLDLDGAAAEAQQTDSDFPALKQLSVHEVILEPGDVIFVPHGWPHQVDNLETSVAISGNFIDRVNLKAAAGEAARLGLVSEDPHIFAGLLNDKETESALQRLEASIPHEHMPLRAYKERHGETRTPSETQRLIIGTAALGTVMLACGAVSTWRWLSRPSGAEA
eukprot:TRINITY_DN60958_c0_g1_i1.p1 TRINITY_DN60958_c0_g1~~TRINITY_DN60958_c0_g1_i1.p1  ORF type:complete len:499 (-),score=68.13 TRINITY_DN60958_c0_g1_i1:30-1526(-)